MPIKNGKQYIDSIDRLKANVLFQGKRVTSNISEHLSFRGLVLSQASLYDLQCDERYLNQMTYLSPSSGEPVGLSFLQPKTKNVKARRTMMSN